MKKLLSILLCTAIIIFLLVNPSKYIASVSSGITMFCTSVLPALLPFMVLSSLLSKLGVGDFLGRLLHRPTRFIFNAPSVGSFIFVMATISGNPIGAKLILEYKNNELITEKEAKQLVGFTTCVSPIYIIGTVGTLILSSTASGYRIYFAHLLGAIITGIIFGLGKKTKCSPPQINPVKHQNLLFNSILESIQTLLLVGTIVTLSYMLIDMIFATNLMFPMQNILAVLFEKVGLPPQTSESICIGFFEITKGIIHLNSLDISANLKAIISCGLISFGGICINTQVFIFLKQANISIWYFLMTKLTHLFFAVIIVCFI